MRERNIEGVRVRETGNKQWELDYEASDMETLYRQGDWQSWEDEISWLEHFGERHKRLTPGETVAMVEDLRSLDDNNVPFAHDPDEAYTLAHRHRAENNRRFASEHEQVVAHMREQGIRR